MGIDSMIDSSFDSRRGESRAEALFLKAELGEVPEIDLHGYDVYDAIKEVEDLLTNANLNGDDVVRIVHGSGKGILRGAVRKYLATDSMVDVFRSGSDGYHEGVTVVVLKK